MAISRLGKFRAALLENQVNFITPIDLGEGLTLEGVSHKSGTTRLNLKKLFVIPEDLSQIEISYTLVQDSPQVGSRSEMGYIAYKLLKPSLPLPAEDQSGGFNRVSAGNILVRAVLDRGGSKIIRFDISVLDILYHQDGSEGTIGPLMNEVEFVFNPEGYPHRAVWSRRSLHPSKSIGEGNENNLMERYGGAQLFYLAQLLENQWTSKDHRRGGMKEWSPYEIYYMLEIPLIFETIFGGDLMSLTGFAPDLTQKIVLSAIRKRHLVIGNLLDFSAKK
ncbi:MAG: hypothetical protein IPK68_10395 [Bdellovibrionales bacterium]|nr:hypothetical protein [Bdellovibrionales bacterium]